MDEAPHTALDEICALLTAQKLPRWNELPDIELYMDQVLSLIERYLKSYPAFDARGLTASMVNNYVKLGALPPPVKKRYRREHLARLIVICLLKSCFPIASIQKLVEHERSAAKTEQEAYDLFCERFEKTLTAVASAARGGNSQPELLSAIYHAALRAQAEQALATRLFSALFPQEEKA